MMLAREGSRAVVSLGDDPTPRTDNGKVTTRAEVNFLHKFSRKAPERSDFARMIVRAFESAGISKLEYREEEFALKIPGRDATVFLHNSYTNYCQASREKRAEIVSKLVASFAAIPEIPKDFSSAKQHLMPVVRDVAYQSLTRLVQSASESHNPGMDWQTKPLAGGLIAGLAYDSEHSIATVNHAKLEQWDVSFETAFSTAKDNLWERTDPNQMVGKSGVYQGEWGDSYDSSRILFPELIYRLSLDGDPVAYVPNRDVLLITGKKDTAGLRMVLKKGGESHFNQGHPVSPDLYWLDDGAWKTYVVEDLELRDLWLSTRRRRDALDYAQQKKVLDTLPAYEDVFVANLNLMTRADGGAFSLGVWPRDVDTLLPRSEVIAFVLDEGSSNSVMVIWEAALPIIGELLQEEPGLVPIRYRGRQFPSDSQIEQLRRVAKNPS